jgi:hypothetical protein
LAFAIERQSNSTEAIESTAAKAATIASEAATAARSRGKTAGSASQISELVAGVTSAALQRIDRLRDHCVVLLGQSDSVDRRAFDRLPLTLRGRLIIEEETINVGSVDISEELVLLEPEKPILLRPAQRLTILQDLGARELKGIRFADLRKRQRLAEKASRAPELVVIRPLNSLWTCHRCGGTGDLLVMDNPGPACLRCVGLDDLEFLSAGNALLTRRAKAKSVRHAVVVRFSKSRGRYERQGLLLEPQALAEVRQNLAQQGVMSVGKARPMPEGACRFLVRCMLRPRVARA